MGQFFALMAALTWASAVILFKRSGESYSPYALNLFRVVLSLIVFLPLLAITGMPLFREAPALDYLILAASGILGIAVSDTFFHRALNALGAGLTAIVDCLYSPFITGFAFLLLGERLAPPQLAGMVLVIGGVLVASRHDPPPGATARQILKGIGYGAAAMATVALAIVMAKPVLERHPVLWSTTVRQLACVLAMVPVALASRQRRRLFSVFVPSRGWRYSIPGTLLGSCLALLFWIGGMKYARAGAAAILNQTSTIYVLLFASLFLKERFTARKIVAAALALGGILLVTSG